MTPLLPKPETAAPPTRGRKARPSLLALIAMVALLVAGGLLALRMIRDAPGMLWDRGRQAGGEVARQAVRVAQAFREGTMRQEFTSQAVALAGTSYFQFATLKQAEVFRREESGSAAWGLIPLPKVVVQAQAPVEYSYHLDFNGTWEFRREGNVLTVQAPPITPNPPALDVSALTFYTLEGSVWRDERAVRERLRQTLTGELQARAVANIGLVREVGRARITQFVQKWLREKFSDGEDFQVRVLFPEDPRPGRGVISDQ